MNMIRITALIALSVCLISACGPQRLFHSRDAALQHVLSIYFADQKPQNLSGHTFLRREKHTFNQLFYFTDKGRVYLADTSSELMRSGTWHIQKAARFSLSGDQLCMTFAGQSECSNYSNWSEKLVSSYRTDFLELSSRRFRPCLANSENVYAWTAFVEYKPFLGNDNIEMANQECHSIWEEAFDSEFDNPATEVSSAYPYKLKQYQKCLGRALAAVYQTGILDKHSIISCMNGILTEYGMNRAVEFLEFEMKNRDLSIYSQSKRERLKLRELQ